MKWRINYIHDAVESRLQDTNNYKWKYWRIDARWIRNCAQKCILMQDMIAWMAIIMSLVTSNKKATGDDVRKFFISSFLFLFNVNLLTIYIPRVHTLAYFKMFASALAHLKKVKQSISILE